MVPSDGVIGGHSGHFSRPSQGFTVTVIPPGLIFTGSTSGEVAPDKGKGPPLEVHPIILDFSKVFVVAVPASI